MKNLTKTLLASAVLTLAAGSAFAQLTPSGTALAPTCTIGFSTTAAGAATAALPITLPPVPRGVVNALTAAGPIKAAAYKTTFFVKPIDTTCVGGASGTFNVYFSASAADTNNVKKASNTTTSADKALNLVIDLIPTTATTKATADLGMDMTLTTAADQHGMAAVNITNGALSVDARYWKTTTAVTAGTNVSGRFTATIEYQ